MALIKYHGQDVAVTTQPLQYLADLASNNQPTDGYTIHYTKDESLYAKRKKIYETVADADSLLGTAADAAQLLVLFACSDLVALSEAQTFEQYKQSRLAMLAQLSGDTPDYVTNMTQSAGDFISKVKSGEIKLPFLEKPNKALGVFTDVANHATGVAKVLASKS